MYDGVCFYDKMKRIFLSFKWYFNFSLNLSKWHLHLMCVLIFENQYSFLVEYGFIYQMTLYNVYILLSLFTFKNVWNYKITYAYNMLVVVWVKSNWQDFSSIQNRHLYYHNVNSFKILNWVVSFGLAKRFPIV